MKRSLSFIIVLAVVFTTLGTANARHQTNSLEGLLFGAGTGAIVGHVIGRDAEGAMVGSVIGGTLGMMIGLDRDHAVVYDRPLHAPQVRVVYHNGWDNQHRRWDNKRRQRGNYRHWRQEERHYRR